MTLQQAQKNLSIWCLNCAVYLQNIEDLCENLTLCSYTTPDEVLKKWADLFSNWYHHLSNAECETDITENERYCISEAKLALEELKDLYTFE
jgi:hypothetical protein